MHSSTGSTATKFEGSVNGSVIHDDIPMRDDGSINRDEASLVPSAKSNNAADFRPSWRFYLAFLSLSVVTLAAALDATSLSVGLPLIAMKLNGSAIEAFWAGTSFLLTSTVFQPSYGSFSHIFGRKPLIFVAMFFFTIGAVICALSKNFTIMLTGRSLQGIGAGGITTLCEIIITDMVPLQERGKWFGFLSGMWSVGSVAGPIVGGAFVQKASWTWIFWINLPIIGVGTVLVAVFLQLHHSNTAAFGEQLKRVDWLGTVIFVASTTSLLIPITWGGVMYPWSDWRTLVPLIIGFVGLAAFVPYEKYIAKEPLLRLSIFNNRTSCIVYFQTFIHGNILWSLLYYGPIYFEAVRGYSPILTGVAMFPETFTVAPAAVVVGVITALTGKYRWALWSGWLLTSVGMGLLYLETSSMPAVQWVFLNLVPGTGTGMLFAAMGIAIPAACEPIDMAHAVAFFTFFRAFGNCAGVAIGGSIFQNSIKRQLLTYPLLAADAVNYSEHAEALVEVIKFMEKGVRRDQLIEAYMQSLRVVFVTMSALSAVAMLSNFWVKAYTLDQELVTEQRFVQGTKAKDAERDVPTRDSNHFPLASIAGSVTATNSINEKIEPLEDDVVKPQASEPQASDPQASETSTMR